MAGSPISLNALESLHQAKPHFDLEILHKEINGRNRVVILAGEFHLKNDEASASGKQMLQHFKFRGLEGIHTTRTSWLVRTILALNGVFSTRYKRANKLQGSTITDAALEKNTHDLAKLFALEILKASEVSSLELSGKQVERIEAMLRDKTSYFGKAEFLEEEFIPLLKKYVSNQPVNFPMHMDLEKDHNPGFKENFTALNYLLPYFTVTAHTLFLPLLYFYPEFVPVYLTSLAGFGTASAYSLAERLLEKYSDKKWFSSIFFSYDGILEDRNVTMVKNLQAGLQENQSSEQFLVLLGGAHLEGMKKLLRADGFQSAELPPLPIH